MTDGSWSRRGAEPWIQDRHPDRGGRWATTGTGSPRRSRWAAPPAAPTRRAPPRAAPPRRTGPGPRPEPPRLPGRRRSHGDSGKTAGVVVAAVLGGVRARRRRVHRRGDHARHDRIARALPSRPARRRPTHLTATGRPDAEGTEPTDDEPTESGDEALLASAAHRRAPGGDAWELSPTQPLPLESTEACSPSGLEHRSGVNRSSDRVRAPDRRRTRRRGDRSTSPCTGARTTPRPTSTGPAAPSGSTASASGSSEPSGDTDPEFEAIPEDPQAPGVAYIERSAAAASRPRETVHYVFVGRPAPPSPTAGAPVSASKAARPWPATWPPPSPRCRASPHPAARGS